MNCHHVFIRLQTSDAQWGRTGPDSDFRKDAKSSPLLCPGIPIASPFPSQAGAHKNTNPKPTAVKPSALFIDYIT